MPNLPITEDVALPLEEIELRVSRSSGPGGQHANVTASRVEAIFDVHASQALSEAQKARIGSRLGGRVTAGAQDTRSQHRNRELALERLGPGGCRRAQGGPPAHEDAPDARVAEAAGGEQEAARRDQARAAAAGRGVGAAALTSVRGGADERRQRRAG